MPEVSQRSNWYIQSENQTFDCLIFCLSFIISWEGVSRCACERLKPETEVLSWLNLVIRYRIRNIIVWSLGKSVTCFNVYLQSGCAEIMFSLRVPTTTNLTFILQSIRWETDNADQLSSYIYVCFSFLKKCVRNLIIYFWILVVVSWKNQAIL